MLPNEVEIWKTIKDMPRYQVSNLGNVKSLIGKEKILTASSDGKGYLRVKLSAKPKEKGVYIRKDYRIHRLVAEYFCEGFQSNKDVHHINAKRYDNKASNLKCLTKEEHIAIHKTMKKQE